MTMRRRPLFATCLAALIVLQSKADNQEPPSIEVSISGPDAVLLGGPANFTATVTPGDSSYSYQWKVDNVEQDETGSTLAFPRPGSTAAKEVTVRCTATDTSDPETKNFADVTFWHVSITLDNVTGADYIGDQSGTEVYATHQRASTPASVTLKKMPSDAVIPSGFITWSGGQTGADSMERLVSCSALQENGIAVYAHADSMVLFTSAFYIYAGRPVPPCTPSVSPTTTRKDDLVPAHAHGVMCRGRIDPSFQLYYEAGNWRVSVAAYEHEEFWGLANRPHLNVNCNLPSPFPLAHNMPGDLVAGWPNNDAEVRLVAGTSMRQPSPSMPAPYQYYRSEDIITLHELEHINHFRSIPHQDLHQCTDALEQWSAQVTVDLLQPVVALSEALVDLYDEYMGFYLDQYALFLEDDPEAHANQATDAHSHWLGYSIMFNL